MNTSPPPLEQLERAAGWLATFAEAVEEVAGAMAARLAQLSAEQAEVRDELVALSHRLEAVTRAVMANEHASAGPEAEPVHRPSEHP